MADKELRLSSCRQVTYHFLFYKIFGARLVAPSRPLPFYGETSGLQQPMGTKFTGMMLSDKVNRKSKPFSLGKNVSFSCVFNKNTDEAIQSQHIL